MGQEEFAAAVRERLKERDETVGAFAELLGEAMGRKVPYSTLLTWLDRSLDPEVAFAIERCLEVKPGGLTRTLGYLPLEAVSSRSVREAIKVDPALSDVGRRALLAAYREFVKG